MCSHGGAGHVTSNHFDDQTRYHGNAITFQVLLFALAKPPLEKSLEKAFLILCEVTPPSVFAALVDSHHGVSD